uniref:NFATC2-interacting protein n=1 Tax=Poecilia latipinna TaxID=48699 RepID=A0A3B3UI93_9TELE
MAVLFQSTRLSEVLGRLAAILEVPPPRLLLLREELELPAGATVGQLGLGIADILGESHDLGGPDRTGPVHKLLMRGKKTTINFSLQIIRSAPLSSVFSQYLSRLPAGARRSVRFHFDGSKVAGSQTAAQLELEDGDIIEVWT